MTRRTPALAALALALAIPAFASAQCPDGSPPPCRTQVVAQANAPKRVNPPLDDRAWIVVPFDNVSRSQDAEWLRDASVNLLYLDMSRWKDIRVVDDERVADLLRERGDPGNATMSLTTALEIARSAGAGRLVMGDLIKVGSRTAVTAKVFDVRTGQRQRSVREETNVADSVMALFPRLAQKILNVAPPAGANIGVVGTSSIAAYQEYLRGVQALNEFKTQRAREHLSRALALDSAFALAHYKMSIALGWEDPNTPVARTYAEAAARLAATLPPRERALITGHVQFHRREYARSRETFTTLLGADSLDVEAWYGLGDAHFHDNAIEAVDGDTTRLRFAGNVNESIRAFRRALELDPTYHLAYQHIVDAYLWTWRNGRYCREGRCRTESALSIRSGDTLLTAPSRGDVLPQAAEYFRSLSRKRSVDAAVEVASQWVAASPGESRARSTYAQALFLRGQVSDAARENALVDDRELSNAQRFAAAVARVEVAVKLWDGATANRLYDETRRSPATAVAGGRPVVLGSSVAMLAPLLGRYAEYDSILTTTVAQTVQGAPSAQRMLSAFPMLVLGTGGDSVAVLVSAAVNEARQAMGVRDATAFMGPILALSWTVPPTAVQALDTTAANPMYRAALAHARRDVASLRRHALSLDSLSSVMRSALTPDTGATLLAARAYLASGDSVAALRMTRRMLDSAIAFYPLAYLANPQFPYVVLIPAAMILRADLAAALGHPDEARLWYRRFLDLWANAAPQHQPLVTRLRHSYAALGGT